jgi:CRP-like cAMP-binding protein
MVSPGATERFLLAPFLKDVDAASRTAILNVLTESRSPADSLILDQEQTNDQIFFLIDGTVSVSRAWDGGQEILGDLKAPEVFGQPSYFSARPSIVRIVAKTPVWLLTLDHHAHDLLRRADCRAAEQLALASLRVLARHFDLVDLRVSEFIKQHANGQVKASEWARFRAVLFGEARA